MPERIHISTGERRSGAGYRFRASGSRISIAGLQSANRTAVTPEACVEARGADAKRDREFRVCANRAEAVSGGADGTEAGYPNALSAIMMATIPAPCIHNAR